jgi:hypothetical protein
MFDRDPTRVLAQLGAQQMTLIPYDPARLDSLALRIFDLAGVYRQLAQRCRKEGIQNITLHDKKAMEWLAKLEFWAHESAQKMSLVELHHLGARRAKEILEKS